MDACRHNTMILKSINNLLERAHFLTFLKQDRFLNNITQVEVGFFFAI